MGVEFLFYLEEYLQKRIEEKDPRSYTFSLWKEGEDKILQKVIEEAGEFILASKGEDSRRVVEEGADLLFHFLLALLYQGLSFSSIIEELKKRHRSS